MMDSERDQLLAAAENRYQRWSVAKQWIARLEPQLADYQRRLAEFEEDYAHLKRLLEGHGIELLPLYYVWMQRKEGRCTPVGSAESEELVGELGAAQGEVKEGGQP